MPRIQIGSVPELPGEYDRVTVEQIDLSKRQKRLPFKLYRAIVSSVTGKPLPLMIRREDQLPNEQGDFFAVYPEENFSGFTAVEIETVTASVDQETLIARVAITALQQQ